MDAVEPLRPRSFASAVGVWRVRAGGDSAVLKLLRLDAGPHPRWPSRPEPDDPYYWRREPLAYASGLLEPFGLPARRACVDRSDGSVALWLEDGGDPPRWTPELLGEAAERLGAAHRRLLDPPAEPWLARGWLREYLRLHDVAADETVLARLDTLPQTVCHNDLHPANVLERGFVVDWAFCGIGAVGLDPGVLLADGIADEAVPVEQADEAAEAVWHGYLAGLRPGDESEVRFAFARGTALRLSWLVRDRQPSWAATIDLLGRLASEV